MNSIEFPCYDTLEGEDMIADLETPDTLERVVARELLPKTSPVVTWDVATLTAVRELDKALGDARAATARTIARMPALMAEMEAAHA